MKYLSEIEEAEGKTVLNATFIDCEEGLVLVFTDGDALALGVRFFGDSHELELQDSLNASEQKEAGIITAEEYDKIRDAEKEEYASRRKAAELKQLETLRK